jgi:hypothetical protein
MSQSTSLRPIRNRIPFIPLVLVMITAVAIPAWAGTQLRIASVPPTYTPTAGSQVPEPVSMRGYFFEVEKETGRARVVIEYTYPNWPAFGLDGGPGPAPTIAQIPGLRYHVPSNKVVYDVDGRSVVCANVRDRKASFWNRSKVVPTGACKVTFRLVKHSEDDGWSIRRFSVIDTYFEAE